MLTKFQTERKRKEAASSTTAITQIRSLDEEDPEVVVNTEASKKPRKNPLSMPGPSRAVGRTNPAKAKTNEANATKPKTNETNVDKAKTNETNAAKAKTNAAKAKTNEANKENATPVRILQVTRDLGYVEFLVMLKMEDQGNHKIDWIPSAELKKSHPDLVISFYEKHLVFHK